MTEHSGEFTFASVERKQPGKKSSCAACGQATAGGVMLALQSRRGGKPKMLTSTSRALCERHAVQLYRELQTTFDEFLRAQQAGQ